MRMVLLAITIAASGVVACAPSSKYVQADWNRFEAGNGGGPPATLGVVVDVAIVFDGVGGYDYVAVQESRRAATLMLAATAECLEAKGYEVPLRTNPFVGAFRVSEEDTSGLGDPLQTVRELLGASGIGTPQASDPFLL